MTKMMISGNIINCEYECDSLKQFVEKKKQIADFENLICNSTSLETFYAKSCETKGTIIEFFTYYLHLKTFTFKNCLI